MAPLGLQARLLNAWSAGKDAEPQTFHHGVGVVRIPWGLALARRVQAVPASIDALLHADSASHPWYLDLTPSPLPHAPTPRTLIFAPCTIHPTPTSSAKNMVRLVCYIAIIKLKRIVVQTRQLGV